MSDKLKKNTTKGGAIIMPDRRQRSWCIVVLGLVAVGVAFAAVSTEENVSEGFSPLFGVRVAYAAELEPIEVKVAQMFNNNGPICVSTYSQPLKCSVGEVQILQAPLGDAEAVNVPTVSGLTCVSTCMGDCPTMNTCGYTCVTCVATMMCSGTCWATCEATCEATCLSCEPPCPMSGQYGW